MHVFCTSTYDGHVNWLVCLDRLVVNECVCPVETGTFVLYLGLDALVGQGVGLLDVTHDILLKG